MPMFELDGWLLDVYADGVGAVIWLLGDDGKRHRLNHAFPITFYVAGPFPRLRQLWAWLRDRISTVRLARERRVDLFAGELDVLAIETAGPAEQARLFGRLVARFPELDYYDADIPLPLRYAARHELFPLARCRVVADGGGRIVAVTPLDSPWDLDPPSPPLRTLTLVPDVDPALRPPAHLIVTNGRGLIEINVDPPDALLSTVHSLLRRHDPDLVLTRWGDTWLFPRLLEIQRQVKARYFNPNRDPDRRPLRRRAASYFTYGQVMYRGEQVHLFGRWHIDSGNAMMYVEYGLPGVLEQARVTALPVQEIARKSPGAGITAMQMLTALRRGILIPYQKQQTERFKSALDLIQADRGGLVYQPLVGLHDDVAEIDFTSMYPSIMVRFNISPEAVGVPSDDIITAPGLDLVVDQTKEGLVPATLRPLLIKRLAIKALLNTLHPLDCRYRPLKARATALKWLLVVCFGYLGYKNARFGRIEGHEAVTAYGREMLLRAKEAAEDLGYTVLHMYVDGLWVRHPKDTAGGLADVMAEITRRTALPISLEGIYRWIAFLPSRVDERIPVPNRYFGVFRDGSLKMRGIEARRHDTPPFIAAVQMRVLELLAVDSNPSPEAGLPAVIDLLRSALDDLRRGRVDIAELLVSHRLSRELSEYKGRPPGARAAAQLAATGKPQQPGRRVRFIYTLGEPGVYAWGSPEPLDRDRIDTARYEDLLLRAAASVLQPFIDETLLRKWVAGDARQLPLWRWAR